MLARSIKSCVSRLQRINPHSARSFAHRVSMILKEDVPKLGVRGNEVSVKAGYARNFLYPEKLAVYATNVNREKYKMDHESGNEAQLEKEHKLEAIIYNLSKMELVFKRQTASKADVRLRSEVNAQNISDMLVKQHGVIVGLARIDLPTPIKTVGEHSVKIRVDDSIEEAAGVESSSTVEEIGAEDRNLKKGPSKKKWVSLTVQVERR